MDIYDVIEALKRQRILLGVGLALLIVVVLVGTFTLDDGSIRQRFAPRYEATTQMVVVPQGVEDLTDPNLTSADFRSVAAVYADLLSSERAQEEIVERSDSRIDSMKVSTGSGSPVITIQVESPTAAESSSAAVMAFSWLEDRLQAGGTVASVPVPVEAVTPEFDTSIIPIVIRSEPTFIDADPNTWISFETPAGDMLATPLYVLEGDTLFNGTIGPGETVTITVGPEIGAPDDFARVLTPPLNEEEFQRPPPLSVRLRRGAIVFDSQGVPTINDAAISAEWEPPPLVEEEVIEVQAVTVMLLDDQPVPTLIGQRRGPIISAGAFIAGFLSLLVLALMRDTWQMRKRLPAAVAVVPAAEEVDEVEGEHPEPLQPWDFRKAAE